MSTIPSVRRSPPQIIELHFKNTDGRVSVIGSNDETTMLLTMDDAIAACRAHKDQARFVAQFNNLMPHLAEWISARKDKIRAGYVTPRDAGLLFVVVRHDRAFDEELEDQLTSLDLHVARDARFSLIHLDVQPLPDCSDEAAASFLATGRTIKLSIDG